MEIDLSSLLSLLLALFAVFLASLFYFKATETSNRFYDNMNKFTQDISVILGRIEERFGERLRHLDEGYTGLRDRFDRLPFDFKEARKKAEKEKKELAKKEEDFEVLFNELMDRATIEEDKRKDYWSRFKDAQEELVRSKQELAKLQDRIRVAEEPPLFRHDLVSLVGAFLYNPRSPEINDNVIRENFSEYIIPHLTEYNALYMQRTGLINEKYSLTEKGLNFVKQLLDDIRNALS
ncbi:MAG: hypothetical protein JW896_17430 [Deltaproteobacteria bacterium]|nr:hypothetical protein [Deltaproteobacteria bacterium]